MADRKVLQRIYLFQLTDNFRDSGPMLIINGKYKKDKISKMNLIIVWAD